MQQGRFNVGWYNNENKGIRDAGSTADFSILFEILRFGNFENFENLENFRTFGKFKNIWKIWIFLKFGKF